MKLNYLEESLSYQPTANNEKHFNALHQYDGPDTAVVS